MRDAAERYRRYLETLTADTLANLGEYVAPDVHFKDPFNDCRGIAAMQAVFLHMFGTVDDIQFEVHRMAMDGNTCLMDWSFEGQLSGRPWRFDGASVVTFGSGGCVTSHIDHWDAASALYERLPLIGPLLAFFRRRIAVR